MVYHGKNPKILLNYAPTMGMSEVFDSLALLYLWNHTFWGSGCGDIQINLSRKMPNRVYLLFSFFFLGCFGIESFGTEGFCALLMVPPPAPPNPKKRVFFLDKHTKFQWKRLAKQSSSITKVSSIYNNRRGIIKIKQVLLMQTL
jgi:hypothetical protein